jgi:pimeloyl-ACP methyl ester carboxylesterase
MCRYRFVAAVIALATIGAALVAQSPNPPQVGVMRANGADLAYYEEGKGTPVVFVHGAVGDLRFWEPQRRAFAKGHRFVAYSLRYHGKVPWPDDGQQYSAETHAADLAALIKELNAGPAHLVGLSYGGLLAAMVATKEPQIIRTLTLAEPALFGLLAEFPDGKPALEQWSQGAAPVVAAVKSGDALGATKLLIALVTGESPSGFEEMPSELRQILIDNARTLPLLFAAPQATVSCEALRGVKVPTLLVRGERTPEFFTKTNELASRCIAGSKLAVVSGASHPMSYDNPSGFNRPVLDFIDRPTKAPSTQGRGN